MRITNGFSTFGKKKNTVGPFVSKRGRKLIELNDWFDIFLPRFEPKKPTVLFFSPKNEKPFVMRIKKCKYYTKRATSR